MEEKTLVTLVGIVAAAACIIAAIVVRGWHTTWEEAFRHGYTEQQMLGAHGTMWVRPDSNHKED